MFCKIIIFRTYNFRYSQNFRYRSCIFPSHLKYLSYVTKKALVLAQHMRAKEE